MNFIKKHTFTLNRAVAGMQRKCELLMVAWENPENKDSTNDVVAQENEETTDEKIDLVKSTLTDMKVQLGLHIDPDEEFDTSKIQNPIQSISIIHDKMQKVIEKLGLNMDEDEDSFVPQSPKA